MAVAQSLLADQLAHDVDTVSTINDDVKESRQPITHRLVPYIFVAPADRLTIGRLATDVYNRHYAGARGLHHNRGLALLGRLLDAGRNPVRGDLLSYLFFAPEFIQPLIELDGATRGPGSIARASGSLAHRAPVTRRGASGLSTTPFTTCRAADVAFIKRSRLSPTSPMTTGCTGIVWHECHSAGCGRLADACETPARDEQRASAGARSESVPLPDSVTDRSGACGRRLLISRQTAAH